METFTEWDWKFNILIWSTTPPPVSRKFDQCRVEFSCGSEYENSVPGPPATAGQWHDKASHPAPSQGTDTRHVSDQTTLYFSQSTTSKWKSLQKSFPVLGGDNMFEHYQTSPACLQFARHSTTVGPHMHHRYHKLCRQKWFTKGDSYELNWISLVL